jgi:hypothetical protein
MKAHVLKGSKHEIAESLARIDGEVREAIVFVDNPAPAAHAAGTSDADDIFAEMRPFMVEAPDVYDSVQPVIVPIQTLAPHAPAEMALKMPILAVIQEECGAFIAQWLEANISTCGDTLPDALDALKELIVEVAQLHSDDSSDAVGEPMKQQREILARFLCLPLPGSTRNRS